MGTWITVTPKLAEGLKVVNQVDSSKFRLLISRICQALQSDSGTKVFSDEEEEKLLVSLDLNKDELSLLLNTVTLIYTRAASNIVKPAIMENVMKDSFKIDEEKISIFLNAWMTYGKGIIDTFRQKSIFPLQVKDVDWCLNIQTASSLISKDARPVALLQLGLTGEKNVKINAEFEKKELVDLYHNLEKIQKQLDSLK